MRFHGLGWFSIGLAVLFGATLQAQTQAPAARFDIGELRQTARMIPGPRPVRINTIMFAASLRTKNFSVKGAPTEPSVQARTAFQVMYHDGYVMIDSGMDETVHKTFGRGAMEPYDNVAAKRLEQAVRGARAIVLTHEHGDHVAGVVNTPFANELAPKTALTRTQLQTLLTAPQMPEIKLTEDAAKRYRVFDYDKYFPLAPGIALMKAPGHTPGSQMIYVILENGAEYLFIGDATWHLDGVRQVKGKDAPWVKEDEEAILAQLTWLHGLLESEKNLNIIPSHDDELRKQYVAKGLLGGSLE
ncbi:MAG: MBL fold metallo-hydrolase [Bryobacteraceae bacterium]